MSCTWALEVPLRLGAGGCERLRDRWTCFPLNSFFSPRDPKQQGKEKALQAQQEPAALAGKATKVELECLGSASLQYTGWFQDQVFSKCWVAGMLFRGSNTIKLMVVIVQRHCARTSQGLGAPWLTGEPSALSSYGDSHEMALGKTPQRTFTDPEINTEIRDLLMFCCHISSLSPKDVTPKPQVPHDSVSLRLHSHKE